MTRGEFDLLVLASGAWSAEVATVGRWRTSGRVSAAGEFRASAGDPWPTWARLHTFATLADMVLARLFITGSGHACELLLGPNLYGLATDMT